MGDTVTHIHGWDDPNDLSRRGSKRRRLLSHRIAEDPNNPELDWQVTQEHAPNFFGVTASTPNRMSTSLGIAPLLASSAPVQNIVPNAASHEWSAQPIEYLPYSENPSYSDPYFYGQSVSPQYTSTWPPTIAQEGYEVQYLNPHGGSESIYDTSASSSYASASNFGSTLFPVQTATPINTYQRDQQIMAFGDTSIATRLQSIAKLEVLVGQLLQIIAKHSHSQFQEMLHERGSGSLEEYNIVKTHLEQAKKSLAGDHVFIDNALAQTLALGQQDTIRKANIATIVTTVLESNNIPFFDLNRYFLEAFVPIGHRLLKWQGAIFLELKTQTYITALLTNEGAPDALLDELFPADLESHILQRHPDAPNLSPSEQDFVDRCRQRRQYLAQQSYNRTELPKVYQWVDFVREFHICIAKNVEHILSTPHRSQIAMLGAANRRRAGSGVHGAQEGVTYSAVNDTQADVRRSTSSAGPQENKKVSANGTTIRQAWTKAEEEALMAGLQRVNGPHWSQILALFGRGGSISEVLKDRNQVQLKDKARNLKLWYLKMGQEVPPSLRGVTGELRKRGGARARAALEAEEQGLAAAKDRSHSDDGESEGVDPMLDIRHDTAVPGATR